MKKFLLVILVSLIFFAKPTIASEVPAPSLSDEIYADLAVRHDLDNVSIYYNNGRPAETIALNETRHWLPASTIKTFAAMYAYKLISDRKLSLYQFVTIDSKNNVPTELVTDELPTLLEGQSVTVDRLLRQMITQSDNTAFNVLLDVLGRDKITDYIQSLGLAHSRVGSKLNLDTSQEQYEFDQPGYGINTTTAEDYGKAFLLIKNNKIAGSKALFNILKDQKINTMIPYFLPKDVVCAHKTGDLDPLYHDGGICQDKNQFYVVTILTDAGDPNLIAHLSEILYTKNYDLVGASITKKTTGENLYNHPLDELVMGSAVPPVLGLSIPDNIQLQPITTKDLGITADDLTSVIKDNNLPPVIIPADSPFHILSDDFVIVKKLFAIGPTGRRAVDLQIAKLRLAEAKDLIKKGKTQQAQSVLRVVQNGLSLLANDSSIVHDPSAQNSMQSVSETRFEILASMLSFAKGQEKFAIIKEIATQAKEMLRNVEPDIMDATNATNLSQKPLIGEVVQTTDIGVIVRTSGGIEVSVPLDNPSLVIREKKSSFQEPASAKKPKLTGNKLTVGSTVALIGSTTNNTFAPTLILTDIPKELSAPQPVTVVKVDTKHNTMVVIENGVYTQVNVSQDTSIKGQDTDIPLKEIRAGDIVVVHGEPLIQSSGPKQGLSSPTPSVSGTLKPNPAISLSQNYQSPTEAQTTTNSSKPSSSGLSNQPNIIQSTSIQIVEKKQDVGQNPRSSSPVSSSPPSITASSKKDNSNKGQTSQSQQQTNAAPTEDQTKQKTDDKK